MLIEHQLAIVGTAFTGVVAILLIRSVLVGRAACRELARCLPNDYAQHGSPLPGLFIDARNNAYSIFLLKRQFVTLPDPRMVSLFEKLYRQDTMLLRLIFLGFGLLGVAFVMIELLGFGG